MCDELIKRDKNVNEFVDKAVTEALKEEIVSEMVTAAEKLGRLAAGLKFEDIPADVVDGAKDLILDTIGDSLGGLFEPEPRKIINALKRYDKSTTSTIWGERYKASVDNAAFANTASGEGNDFVAAAGGIGVASIPATAISVGEEVKADGKTIITSIVAAIEVWWRIGSAMSNATLSKRAFYWPSLPLGATIAAGKVLNLTNEQMTWALALAASTGAGMWEVFDEGIRAKLLFHGRSANTGVFCSYLAKEGFIGPTRIFEAERGFLKAYTDPDYDVSKLTQKIEPVEFLGTRQIVYKPYPSCRATHSSIGAALKIAQEYKLKAEDIDSVTITLATRDADLVGIHPTVSSKFDAQFSLHYVVSSTIIEGRVPTLDTFMDEKLRDPKVLELMKRVKVIGDEALQKLRFEGPPGIHPSRLLVVTKDGKEYRAEVDYYKGSKKNPLTKEELRAKFEMQAKNSLPSERVSQVYSKVQNLEKLGEINELTRLLCAQE